ncbi:MAG TPA: CDP-diacylglycerol diphosphatase [Stellaceae bacterium]|nr:CDP-diacylglycerol diphosphatase [Stellaceae bacterium]
MRRLLPALLALLAWVGAAHADPDALWRIASQKCVPNEREYGQPSPCAKVDIEGGEARGYVILKDLVGDTQYLLIPTAKVTGIEDPALLAPDAANYFAAAWRERDFTDAAATRPLSRDELSLAVNSAHGRSQNQLHIHIDCIAPAVRDAVLRNAAKIGESWAPFPEPLAAHPYRAIRVGGEELDGFNPFVRLAADVPGAREAMGQETLAVVGTSFDGKPGFVVLAGHADAATGNPGSSEELQDHSCALARP